MGRYLNQYTFVLRDPLKTKAPATWTFAESTAPATTIEGQKAGMAPGDDFDDHGGLSRRYRWIRIGGSAWCG